MMFTPLKSLAVLTVGGALLLSGCSMDSATAALDDRVQTIMDNHDYVEVPWDLFMLEHDKEALTPKTLTDINTLTLEGRSPLDQLVGIQERVEATADIINDTDRYVSATRTRRINDPLYDIYGSERVADAVLPVLSEVYSATHQYPDALDVVAIGGQQTDDGLETVVKLDWKVLQDSAQFIVYPLTFRMNETGTIRNVTVAGAYETPVYARPLERDAYITDTMHDDFESAWHNFRADFNQRDTHTSLNSDHLSRLASDGIALSDLRDLFDYAEGDLWRAGLVAWEAHDKDAQALSTYTFHVPNYEDDTLTVTATFSRSLNEITAIELSN